MSRKVLIQAALWGPLLCECVHVGGQACPHTGSRPHSADSIQVTRSPVSTRWLQALQTHHFLGASSGLRSLHRILTTTLRSRDYGPILLERNLRLREVEACQRPQGVQTWGYHPGPHPTPWAPGATLCSASVFADSACLLEHSPPCSPSLQTEQALMALRHPRGRWSLTSSSRNPLLASTSPSVTLAFPATTLRPTHTEPPAWLLQSLLTRQFSLPLSSCN